jgi:hypothetical protein
MVNAVLTMFCLAFALLLRGKTRLSRLRKNSAGDPVDSPDPLA